MKDMKTVIIAVLCGVIAGLALILKKHRISRWFWRLATVSWKAGWTRENG